MVRKLTLLTLSIALTLGCNSRPEQSSKSQTQSTSSDSTVTVLVATQSVPNWKPLTRDLVEWRECDAIEVPINAIRFGEPLAPHGVVQWGKDCLKYPVYQGTPIRRTDIARGSNQDFGMARGGYQVFAIRAELDDPIAQSLNPTSSVDIEVRRTNPKTSSRSEPQPFHQTILRNVRIFKIDIESDWYKIHLLVRPDQSEKLLLAKQLGKVGIAPPFRASPTHLEKSKLSTN